jgi:hypothetical protein
MHFRHAAVSCLVLVGLQAAPAVAERDAATKAREGDVDQWIKYYQRERSEERPPRPQRETAGQPDGERKDGTEQKEPKAEPVRR